MAGMMMIDRDGAGLSAAVGKSTLHAATFARLRC
jgi:hypothetical protein